MMMDKKISFSIMDNPNVTNDTFLTKTSIGKGKAARYGRQFTENEVKKFFQKRYEVASSKSFDEIWKHLQAHSTWVKQPGLSVGKLREIDELIKKHLVVAGHGIPAPHEKNPETIGSIKEVVKALLHGGNISTKVLRPSLLKAIFLSKDPAMLSQLRSELQFELNQMALNPPKTKKEKLVWEAFKGNIIALLPFTYPEPGTKFKIPVIKGNAIKLIDYTANVIPLHGTKYSSPMHALALTPDNPSEGNPLLSFIGTTYPAGDGFATTVMADFTPGLSVGEGVYKKNKVALDNWFHDKKDVEVYGMSLGGAMALHAFLYHGSKLSKVAAFNPPGFSKNYWKYKVTFDAEVNIYTQPGDIVSKLGFWPTMKNVNLYTVLTHQEGMRKHPIANHARAYTGCKNLTIIKDNTKSVNKNALRRWLTWAHKYLGPTLVYRPILAYLYLKNKFLRKQSSTHE